jgi:MFS superfamily sulfate permease-like transporter
MLVELNSSLRKAGIELCVAGMKDPTKDMLKRFGIFKRIDAKKVFFPTLNSAINNYLKTYSIDWHKRDEA